MSTTSACICILSAWLTSCTILTDIQHSFRILMNHMLSLWGIVICIVVFASDWRNVARWILRANSRILLSRIVILDIGSRFILVSYSHLLLIIILLLRNLEIFSGICSELLGTRSSSNWSSNWVRFIFTRSLAIVTFFFNNKLICLSASFRILHFHLQLSLSRVSLILVIETS